MIDIIIPLNVEIACLQQKKNVFIITINYAVDGIANYHLLPLAKRIK